MSCDRAYFKLLKYVSFNLSEQKLWPLKVSHPFVSVYRYFNEFLMAHSRETAQQVRSEYMDTMGKIYYSYFKDYHSKLMKLQVCTIDERRLLEGGCLC